MITRNGIVAKRQQHIDAKWSSVRDCFNDVCYRWWCQRWASAQPRDYLLFFLFSYLPVCVCVELVLVMTIEGKGKDDDNDSSNGRGKPVDDSISLSEVDKWLLFSFIFISESSKVIKNLLNAIKTELMFSLNDSQMANTPTITSQLTVCQRLSFERKLNLFFLPFRVWGFDGRRRWRGRKMNYL